MRISDAISRALNHPRKDVSVIKVALFGTNIGCIVHFLLQAIFSKVSALVYLLSQKSSYSDIYIVKYTKVLVFEKFIVLLRVQFQHASGDALVDLLDTIIFFAMP